MDIDSNADIIDSRDVIERMDELKAEIEEYEIGLAEAINDESKEADDDNTEAMDLVNSIEIAQTELEKLEALASDGEGYSDWIHGALLINEDYFEDYAKQMAEDLGLIPDDAAWPACHIDWEAAADALRSDYSQIEWEGTTFYVR